MKNHSQCLFVTCVLLLSSTGMAFAQGTAFMYHGRLNDNGIPASGNYDLTFAVFDADTGSHQVGGTLTNAAVAVTNGLFTVTLDFGMGAFDGRDRWLEMGVRPSGGGNFSLLNPRQLLTPTPYAIMANSASNLLGTLPADQLSGIVPEARLGTNVALLNGNPTFSGNFTILGDLLAARLNVGLSNTLTSLYSTIGGGYDNKVQIDEFQGHIFDQSDYAVIGGGTSNLIRGAPNGTIAGGANNTIYGQFGWDTGDTISGGSDNIISSYAFEESGHTTIGGGKGNQAMKAVCGIISGGVSNKSTSASFAATIGGGRANEVSGTATTIGGGEYNYIDGNADDNDPNTGSTIGGGSRNVIGSTFYNNPTYHTAKIASTIAGGYNNQIHYGESGAGGTIGGGFSNVLNGAYSTIPGGAQARAGNYGQLAYASGAFADVGDAQTSVYVCRGITTDGTQIELFLDGKAQRMRVPPNTTWAYDILVTGRAANGDSAAYQIRGAIKNNAGTTTLVGSPNVTVLAADVPAWDATVFAGDMNDVLLVDVTGTAGTTIRWVASVRTVEVSY